jgi:ABC-2 type transport system ATP-binding protein
MNLTINNLSKTYTNGVKALKDVSLVIPNGLFGLLGPNGAGKSTLIRTIATLQEPDNGEIWLDDLNIIEHSQDLKQNLGYLPQEFGFYPKDRADDLLNHFIMLKGINDKADRKNLVEYLLKKVNLWDARKQKIGTFSGGMKQRFGIAQALIGNPKLIIVDEPTAGLDPNERKRFHNLLSEIGRDIIVILSTHIVDDVSNLCTNMAIIDNGKILLQTDPTEVVLDFKGKIWEKEIHEEDLKIIQERFQVISTRLFAGKTFVKVFSEKNPEDGFLNVEPILEDIYFFTLQRSAN